MIPEERVSTGETTRAIALTSWRALYENVEALRGRLFQKIIQNLIWDF
jgi:hypothetical protein